MARRPRLSLPLTIKLSFDQATGFYVGMEEGITYKLTYEQVNELKWHFRGSHGFNPTITTWYNSLSRFDKKKVMREGAAPAPDDFTPDPEWPD